MIVVGGFNGRRVAVLGLAKSGRAAAHSLAAGGAQVLAWDDNPAVRDAVASEITLYDPTMVDWRDIPALVPSPGIPLSFPEPHPVVLRARAAGAEIIGDIELLGRAQPATRYVGITGTNGKSTTTALTGHILAAAGRRVEVGGNLGTPALTLAPLAADETYVLEASSFQLDLITSLAFDIAVLLNITPDHLGRHGGMDGYIAAKKRIFGGQRAPQAAIVGIDDPICAGIERELARAAQQNIIPISAERPAARGVYTAGGCLIDDTKGNATRILEMAGLARLPGIHNWQNAAAAYAAVHHAGVATEAASAGLHSFPGLAHRQELIATIDGVRYINDSKATNADAAAKALACYENIYWIAGGLAKEGGIESLSSYHWRIRHAFLIGQAAPAFAETLGGQVPHSRCGELAAAIAAARELALREGRRDA